MPGDDIFIGTSDENLVFSKYSLKNNSLVAERERWSTYDVDAVLESSWTDKYELSRDEAYALEKAATSDKRKIRRDGIKLADSFNSNNIEERKELLAKLEKEIVVARAKNIKSIAKQNPKVR